MNAIYYPTHKPEHGSDDGGYKWKYHEEIKQSLETLFHRTQP